MNYMNLLVILGIVIIMVLGSYAFYLYLKLRSQKARLHKQQEELVNLQKERHDHYRNSIRVIASAIVAEQVGLTEGAIRISMLVSQLDLSESEKADYQVFFQLTEATSHIPILDEWKKLSSLEKQRYDSEREELEKAYKEFVESAAKELLAMSGNSNPEPLFYSVGKN